MQTTTLERHPELQARLEAYQATRTRFEAARAEIDHLDSDAQKHRKAAEAAEVEALQARGDVVQLIRKHGSVKDIHQFKAKERAAYTLAEDYRAVLSETQAACEEANYKAGAAKYDERSDYTNFMQAYADALMREAEDLIAPLFLAIRVRQSAYAHQAGRGMADWEYSNGNARDAALARMYELIKRGFEDFKFDPATDPVLQAATRPAGVDEIQEVSPATQYRDRVRREQAAAQQD